MKVAILVALSDDQRSGQPVSQVLPQDEAVALFKAAVTAGRAPDKDLPTLEVWTRLDGRAKTQRFDPARAARLKPVGKPSPKAKELECELHAAKARIAELEELLVSANAALAERPLLDESPLVPVTP
jgi:hypothetical protein